MKLLSYFLTIIFFGISWCPAVFSEEFDYTIITSDRTAFSDTKLEAGISRVLGHAHGRRLDLKSPEAADYIRQLKIDHAPYVVFPKRIIDHPKFFELARSGMIDRKNGEYIVPPDMVRPVGILLFNRERKHCHLDFFVTSQCPRGKTAFRQIDDYLALHPDAFSVTAHYISTFRDFGIDSAYGVEEIKEDIRQIILQRYYPESFFQYHRRFRAGETFEKIFPQLGIDIAEIVARQDEGVSLLRQDFNHCRDLGIKKSPAFLWENQVLLTGLDAFRDYMADMAHEKDGAHPATQHEATNKKINIAVFYSPDCSHCRWLIDAYLPKTMPVYAAHATFELFDISIPANHERQVEMQKAHGVFGNSIPEVFVGDIELVGREEIEKELEPTLRLLLGEGKK